LFSNERVIDSVYLIRSCSRSVPGQLTYQNNVRNLETVNSLSRQKSHTDLVNRKLERRFMIFYNTTRKKWAYISGKRQCNIFKVCVWFIYQELIKIERNWLKLLEKQTSNVSNSSNFFNRLTDYIRFSNFYFIIEIMPLLIYVPIKK
jgi:hypothetical protein